MISYNMEPTTMVGCRLHGFDQIKFAKKIIINKYASLYTKINIDAH